MKLIIDEEFTEEEVNNLRFALQYSRNKKYGMSIGEDYIIYPL